MVVREHSIMRAKSVLMAVGIVMMAFQTSRYAQAGDIAFGEYLSGECVTCHSRVGANNGIPPIVGWPVDQFAAVMTSYRDKTRDNQVMQTIAARLTAEEVAALAAYFATLQPARCQQIAMC